MLRFLLKRKLIVGLFVIFIFIAGLYGMNHLDKELFPKVDFNQTFVVMETEEMPAEDVEQFVTIPIEQVLDQIEGVESYESSSMIGVSTILVDVKAGASSDITKDIESEVNQLKEELYGVTNTTVMQVSTNYEFEMYLDISGGNYQDMETLGLDVVKPKLEALPEVGKVEISGLKTDEVQIIPKPKKLAEHGIQEETIIAAMEQTNQSSTIGTLEKETGNPALRFQSTLQHTEDLRQLPLETEQGPIKLSDVADIESSQESGTANAWKNGNADFLIVQIGRSNDVGQVELTEAVRKEIANIKQETDNPAQIHEIAAQGDYVGQAIDGIILNIIIGGIIAIIVLLLFLRNIRATIIIGLSIPASILLTILTMVTLDYSFNLLSLIGLGLGIGMMVDASIVVLESIFKKKELGYNKLDAVLIGTKEVAGAIMASMLTTIVVFLPIVLLDDDVGKMILILTVVIAVTLISSVIIAFTLIPVLSENFLKVKPTKKPRFNLMEGYGAILQWISRKKRRRISIIGFFILIFISSFFLLSKIPVTFMPDILNRYSEVAVELEPGTPPKERADIAKQISGELEQVTDVASNVILDNSDMLVVLINMTSEEEKTMEQADINEHIFTRLRALENDGPISHVAPIMDGTTSPPIEIRIEGEDIAVLEAIGSDVVTDLEKVDGIVSANMMIGKEQEEYQIQIDNKKTEADQLSSADIVRTVDYLFTDQTIGELTADGDTTPIKMKHDVSIHDKQTLLDHKIPTEQGEKPLSTYLSLQKKASINQIDRNNGVRYLSIVADYENADLSTIHTNIDKLLTNMTIDDGYSASVAGDLKEQQKAAQDLVIIFAISLFLVFVVMAIQLNSLKFPLIILCIIPLTITGVLFGLFITQKELNILSAIGVIMLIGIVINNGILLIDRTRQLREQGKSPYEAIVLAGKERIRPIFMTTFTTVGGMLPLAFATGTSSDYQSPLAVVIISGLAFSTLITLLLIPALYLVLEDANRGLNRLFRRRKKSIEHNKKAIG